MALVAAVMFFFFAFQLHADFQAIFGNQASDRMITASMLISNDLNKVKPENYNDILALEQLCLNPERHVPLIITVATVVCLSTLFWIPLVRNIKKPIGHMTKAVEAIARGKFDSILTISREDEIGRLADAINHMTLSLRGYVEGQKRFLGDVVHELRSPLARIQLGLEIIELRLPMQNRNALHDVIEDVTEMSMLVNELLTFSMTDICAAKVKVDKVHVLPVVQRVLRKENISSMELTVSIDPKFQVVADEELLARAIANIIRNAIAYSGNSGPIKITAEKKKDTLSIEICDLGPGVPEESLDRLFEPFFRPEPSRDRESGGVGLGLAIVKTCITACNGTVSAKNTKPTGFAITITLST